MILFRVFDWDGIAAADELWGPHHVPRSRQRSGRHDIPDRDGVLYASLTGACAVAEFIQAFRGTALRGAEFVRPGGRIKMALARIEIDGANLADMTDPDTLAEHGWTASSVYGPDRALTQSMARILHQEGFSGFVWPSAVHDECRNVSMFQSRLTIAGNGQAGILPLNVDSPEVRTAAALLSIALPTDHKT